MNATLTCGVVGVGGTRFEPVSLNAISGTSVPTRIIQSERSFGAVLGDVFGNAFPAWTVDVQIGYPIGTSASEASLARARLQSSQAQTQLEDLEL